MMFTRGNACGRSPFAFDGRIYSYGEKGHTPDDKVQPVYSGTADMREVFISLLVDMVRHGKYPVRTFENVKDTHYNEGGNQTKEVI